MSDPEIPQHVPFGVVADNLGLAAEGIILTRQPGGLKASLVEPMDGVGNYIASSARAIKPREEWTNSYEVHDGETLTVTVGALANTHFIVTGCRVSCAANQMVKVDVSYTRLTADNLFNSVNSLTYTLEIVGGFGVVALFGATVATADSALESSLSVSSQNKDAPHPTSGDIQVGSFVVYGIKLEGMLKATSAITEPEGAKVTAADSNEDQQDLKTYSKSWTTYPAAAA